MKTYLISLFILLSNLLNAQVNGVDFSKAIKVTNDTDIIYEKLCFYNNTYIIAFSNTPVGLKHCVEQFGKVMLDNKLEYSNAIIKEVLLAEYVEDLTDYSSLSTSINAESSELAFFWDVNGWMTGFMMNKTVVAIIFKNDK